LVFNPTTFYNFWPDMSSYNHCVEHLLDEDYGALYSEATFGDYEDNYPGEIPSCFMDTRSRKGIRNTRKYETYAANCLNSGVEPQFVFEDLFLPGETINDLQDYDGPLDRDSVTPEIYEKYDKMRKLTCVTSDEVNLLKKYGSDYVPIIVNKIENPQKIIEISTSDEEELLNTLYVKVDKKDKKPSDKENKKEDNNKNNKRVRVITPVNVTGLLTPDASPEGHGVRYPKPFNEASVFPGPVATKFLPQMNCGVSEPQAGTSSGWLEKIIGSPGPIKHEIETSEELTELMKSFSDSFKTLIERIPTLPELEEIGSKFSQGFISTGSKLVDGSLDAALKRAWLTFKKSLPLILAIAGGGYLCYSYGKARTGAMLAAGLGILSLVTDCPAVKWVIDKCRVLFSVSDDMEPQMSGEHLTNLADMIFGFISISVVGKTPSEGRFKAFRRECETFMRQKEGFEAIFVFIVNIVEKAINFVRERLLGLGPVHLLQAAIPEVKAWCNKVEAIADLAHAGKLERSRENGDRVYNLVKEGQRLSQIKAPGFESPRVRSIISTYMNTIRNLYASYSSMNLTGGGPRMEPLTILVRGEPGVGKSWATIPLLVAIMRKVLPMDQLADFSENWGQFIYCRQAEQEYWDGYHSQFATVFDDFGQMRDQTGKNDNEFMDIIRGSNLFPHVCHMADLSSKGTTLFLSKIMLLTTNLYKFNIESLTQPEALYRRFDSVVDIVPKVEYCSKDTLGKGLRDRRLNKEHPVVIEKKLNPDIWEFHEFVYDMTPDGLRSAKGSHRRTFTFDEVVDMLVEQYRAKSRVGDDYVEAIRERVKMKPQMDNGEGTSFDREDRVFMESVVDEGESISPPAVVDIIDLESLEPESNLGPPHISESFKEFLRDNTGPVESMAADIYLPDERSIDEILSDPVKKVDKISEKFFEFSVAMRDPAIDPDFWREVKYIYDNKLPEWSKRSISSPALLLFVIYMRFPKAFRSGLEEVGPNVKERNATLHPSQFKLIRLINHYLSDVKLLVYDVEQLQDVMKFRWTKPYMWAQWTDMKNRLLINIENYCKWVVKHPLLAFLVDVAVIFSTVSAGVLAYRKIRDWTGNAKRDQPIEVERLWLKLKPGDFTDLEMKRSLDPYAFYKNHLNIIRWWDHALAIDAEADSKAVREGEEPPHFKYTNPVHPGASFLTGPHDFRGFSPEDTEEKVQMNQDFRRAHIDYLGEDGKTMHLDTSQAVPSVMATRWVKWWFFPLVKYPKKVNMTKKDLEELGFDKYEESDYSFNSAESLYWITLIDDGLGEKYPEVRKKARAKLEEMLNRKVDMLEELKVMLDTPYEPESKFVGAKQKGHQKKGDHKKNKAFGPTAPVHMKGPKMAGGEHSYGPQGGFDQQAEDIAVAMAKKNMYTLHFSADDESRGIVLVLKGRIALIPKHFVHSVKQQSEEGTIKKNLILRSNFYPSGIALPVANILACQQNDWLKSRDLCIFLLPKSFHMHPDITEKFVTRSQMDKPLDLDVKLVTPRSDGGINASMGRCAKVMDTPVSTAPASRYEDMPHSWRISSGFRYQFMTKRGDCGSVLMIQNPSIPRKLIGIHVAGDNRGMGISAAVTAEDLEEALTLVRDDSIIADYNDMCVAQMSDFPFTGNFLPVGKVNRAVHHSTKTKLRRSRLYGTWMEPLTAPAKLHPFEEDGVYIDPRKNATEKYCQNSQLLDQEVVDIAAQHLYSGLHSTIFKEGTKPLEVFDFKKAVSGDCEIEYCEKINMQTSAGYPWCLDSPPGYSGKEWWFGRGDEIDFERPQAKELERVVVNMIDKAREGIRLPHVYVDHLKDERRKHEKVHKGMTRLISACPLDLQIAFRMFFYDFCVRMSTRHMETGITGGLNSYSPSWDLLARDLQSRGKKAFDGDIKCLDGSEMCQVLVAICDLISKLYADGKSNRLVREILFYEILQSAHIFYDIIYLWWNSLPSGNPLTFIVNSLYIMIAMRMAFADLHPCGRHGIQEFDDEVFVAVHGDDNVLNISDRVCSWFNQRTLADQLKQYGLVYTTADKISVMPEWKTLEECSFLKRGFRWEPVLNRFVAPLELNVVLEIPFWYQAGPGAEITQKSNVDLALLELSIHDPEIFDDWVDKIVEASAQYLHYIPKLVSRRSLLLKAASLVDVW